jgi:hypothetical protein
MTHAQKGAVHNRPEKCPLAPHDKGLQSFAGSRRDSTRPKLRKPTVSRSGFLLPRTTPLLYEKSRRPYDPARRANDAFPSQDDSTPITQAARSSPAMSYCTYFKTSLHATHCLLRCCISAVRLAAVLLTALLLAAVLLASHCLLLTALVSPVRAPYPHAGSRTWRTTRFMGKRASAGHRSTPC